MERNNKTKKIALLFIAVFLASLLGWHEVAHAQNPEPRVEASGYHSAMYVQQSGVLKLTASLNNNGRMDNADWWFAAVTPLGVVFLTPTGWTTSIAPVYQGPLFNLPPTELDLDLSLLPLGTYTVYFAVDTDMDGAITPDQIYWDSIQINVSPKPHVPEGPANDTSKIMMPVFMYYLDRYFSDVPNKTDVDMNIASALDTAPPEGKNDLLQTLRWYKSLPDAEKNSLFDSATLELVPPPTDPINLDPIRARLGTVDPLLVKRLDPPASPSALAAPWDLDPDRKQDEVDLTWQDNSNDEDGFHIYRSLNGEGAKDLVATVGSNVTSFQDVVAGPPKGDQYCYEVAAFKNLPSSYRTKYLESSPSSVACSYDAFVIVPDTDHDGVPDYLDECPNDAGSALDGCPDPDGDGVSGVDPKFGKDKCPMDGCSKLDGVPVCPVVPVPNPNFDEGPYSTWTGCPYKYKLVWLGMSVLNDTILQTAAEAGGGLYIDAGGAYIDSVGFLAPLVLDADGNHVTPESPYLVHYEGSNAPVPPESPYLEFAWVNGLDAGGAKEKGTSHWCCGEDVHGTQDPDYKIGEDWEPDADASGEDHPANLDAIRDHGFTVFPAQLPGGVEEFKKIDVIDGLLMMVSMHKRNWSTTITPERTESDIGTVLQSVGSFIASAVGCVASIGFGCAAGIVSNVYGSVKANLAAESSQGLPYIENVPDDLMGEVGWGISDWDAWNLTRKNGAYGFYFEMPNKYHVVAADQFGDGPFTPVEMRAILYFCLYREGIQKSDVQKLCWSSMTDDNVNVINVKP